MNSDSKPLKRYIVLLNKAPFITFFESPDFISMSAPLRALGITDGDTIGLYDAAEADFRYIVGKIIMLQDPLSYNIIEALCDKMSVNNSFVTLYSLIAEDWQDAFEWQNVIGKPSIDNHYTIVVEKFTHKLSIVDDVNTVIDESKIDGRIHLDNIDSNVPFPLHLLKDCVIEIHDIITGQVIGRDFSQITKSKYTSVMQTGHDTFNYINMRKVENDLKDIIIKSGITVEE